MGVTLCDCLFSNSAVSLAPARCLWLRAELHPMPAELLNWEMKIYLHICEALLVFSLAMYLNFSTHLVKRSPYHSKEKETTFSIFLHFANYSRNKLMYIFFPFISIWVLNFVFKADVYTLQFIDLHKYTLTCTNIHGISLVFKYESAYTYLPRQ